MHSRITYGMQDNSHTNAKGMSRPARELIFVFDWVQVVDGRSNAVYDGFDIVFINSANSTTIVMKYLSGKGWHGMNNTLQVE